MASNHHTDEVFTQKRRPKNPIKFQLQLNEEQKLAKALIVENPVVILKGMAGSGKTLVAVQAALDMLFNKEVEKIIITRPTVAKEELGFLPGDLKEKITINAYKAVCKMMMAQYVLNPISKYGWFNEGKEMLEQSIKMNRNVENIHLRLLVQMNAPSFLGYASDLEKDVQYIKKNLEKSSVSEETKKMILNNLVTNDKEGRFEELAKKYQIK